MPQKSGSNTRRKSRSGAQPRGKGQDLGLAPLGSALLVLLACCGGGEAPNPPDPSALDVTPAMYLKSMSLLDVKDGDRIDLERPPQGGFVLFVGARVRHLMDRSVELRGRLRDGTTGAVLGEEARTVSLLPSAQDAQIAVPDLQTFASVSNIPVCPQLRAADLFDRPLTLEVVVTELSTGRTGTAKRTVVPSCRQTDTAVLKACQCECAANFTAGKCPG